MIANHQKLKALRLKKGWTQAQLAEFSDLSIRTIQRAENTGAISSESLTCLCAVFEIDRAVLMESPKLSFIQHTKAVVTKIWLLLIVFLATSFFAGLLVGYILYK